MEVLETRACKQERANMCKHFTQTRVHQNFVKSRRTMQQTCACKYCPCRQTRACKHACAQTCANKRCDANKHASTQTCGNMCKQTMHAHKHVQTCANKRCVHTNKRCWKHVQTNDPCTQTCANMCTPTCTPVHVSAFVTFCSHAWCSLAAHKQFLA